MRHRFLGSLAMTFLVAATVCIAARADDDKEEKVPLDKVPEAVLKAVKAKFKDAELVGAQTEKEDGKVIYEINLKDKGQSVDVSLTPEGKIVTIERAIAFKDLPQKVQEGINNKYPKAGPFESLNGYVEFRDFVAESTPKPQSSRKIPAAPQEETVESCQPIKKESAQAMTSSANTPTVPPKPLITLKDIPSSTNCDALRWVLFFALFFLTAVIGSFWFFQK